MSNEDREPPGLGIGGRVLGVVLLAFVGLLLWAFFAPAWEAISQQGN